MTDSEKKDQRLFIDSACSATGLSLEEMASQIEQKTLARYRRGEFPLPADKRKHIQALVLSAQGMGIQKFHETFFDAPRKGIPYKVDPDQSIRLNEQPHERSEVLPPPHHVPTVPERHVSVSAADSTLSHSDFAQTVAWLSELFDRHPGAFRTVMGMIKGAHQQETKK